MGPRASSLPPVAHPPPPPPVSLPAPPPHLTAPIQGSGLHPGIRRHAETFPGRREVQGNTSDSEK